MREKYRAQKGPSGPSKIACRIRKNKSYRNYISNFDEPAHPFGVQVLGAPPMYGYNRVYANSREETVIKENTKINLKCKLIKTLKASENRLRFRRFHSRWKAIGELS
jgi:hypothetical protein